MKPWAIALVVVLALRAGPARAAPHASTLIDRIVAVVDGEPILLSTLRARAKPLLHESARVPEFRRWAARRKLYADLLERLIDERLVARAARDEGVAMDRAAVDRGIEQMAAQNHETRSELLDRAREAGLSEEEFRAELGRQLLESRLLWAYVQKQHVKPGADETKRARIMEREHRRWLHELRKRASVQRYFRP